MKVKKFIKISKLIIIAGAIMSIVVGEIQYAILFTVLIILFNQASKDSL